MRVEIYPHESAVEIRGAYTLVNRTGAPIDAVHVVINKDVDARSISLDRAAQPTVVDDETGYRVLSLGQPLQPGDSARLSFDLRLRPRGFRGTSAAQTEVVRNGTYFDRRLLPFVGYQPMFELTGEARTRAGLAPRPLSSSRDDAEGLRRFWPVRNEEDVHLEMVVGTDADQTAVVSAPLRRQWTAGGRRYFHYGADVPTRFGASTFSAGYALVEDRWNDVQLQIFHHPGHQFTLTRMLQSMKASLDYYTKAFGPYQFRELRIVEIPPYALQGGRAMATTIAFAESTFITRLKEGGGDLTFFGTAHEVAHSWWAGQMRVALTRGEGVLSESLANYSAMMVTEKVLGPEQARRIYDFQMDRYLSRRSAFATDVPLVDVEDHPHIAYGKGAVAMYTLREQIGDEAVNGALRRFLEAHRSGGVPYPTARDLVTELRAATPGPLQYLITDLFETVTLWDVKIERAVEARGPDGQYEVTLDVFARKVRADSAGRETETPMDDVIEVGVFGAEPEGQRVAPLYRQPHHIHSGRQTIRITVPGRPARAGLDPVHKLIERDRADNSVEVKAAAPGAGS